MGKNSLEELFKQKNQHEQIVISNETEAWLLPQFLYFCAT